MKERKERDRWQLTRDLTVKEFEECKKSECEFVKKVVNRDSFTGRIAKILKISTKWKIIVYFKDKKSMETAVEESLARESLKRVWKVKNFKEIYSAEKVVKEKTDRQSGTQDLYDKMKGILVSLIWICHHKKFIQN